MRAAPPTPVTALVAFVKTTDRAYGINKALDLLGLNAVKGKNLFIKPNFNSADAFPGSTHPDTLTTLIQRLQKDGAEHITVGDRSGMGNTRSVMEAKGIFRLANTLNFETIVLDELDSDAWQLWHPINSHWQDGFALPRLALESDGIVQTCCLKTHRYGGHFTLSLKNSVGLVAKVVPGASHNYMTELHSSQYQRQMIAEINMAYQPDLIVLDGIEAFVNGGPDKGSKVNSQVILAGTDRIAIDAVGVAILRYFGTTPEVSQGTVFQQEQLACAVELGLGVKSPQRIEIMTDDTASAEYATQLREILMS